MRPRSGTSSLNGSGMQTMRVLKLRIGSCRAAEKTLETLALHPESGPIVPVGRAELEGIRRFRVSDGFERILLFYLVVEDGIELVRVIHGSRDLEQLFGPGA